MDLINGASSYVNNNHRGCQTDDFLLMDLYEAYT